MLPNLNINQVASNTFGLMINCKVSSSNICCPHKLKKIHLIKSISPDNVYQDGEPRLSAQETN